LAGWSRCDFVTERIRAAGRTTFAGNRRLLFFFQRHGQGQAILSRFLRAHVVPSHEQRNRIRIVNRLNHDARCRRMEFTSRFHDLPHDRKPSHGRRCEVCGPFRQIDLCRNVLGNHKVCVSRAVTP
jgi:hypothetical protein